MPEWDHPDFDELFLARDGEDDSYRWFTPRLAARLWLAADLISDEYPFDPDAYEPRLPPIARGRGPAFAARLTGRSAPTGSGAPWVEGDPSAVGRAVVHVAAHTVRTSPPAAGCGASGRAGPGGVVAGGDEPVRACGTAQRPGDEGLVGSALADALGLRQAPGTDRAASALRPWRAQGQAAAWDHVRKGDNAGSLPVTVIIG